MGRPKLIVGDEPIYIHRKTYAGDDEYGNPSFTTEQILVRNALLAFGSTNEPVEITREAIDASITLYLPAGTVVEDGDEFEIRETMWVKNGNSHDWQHLWGGFSPGVAIQIRKRKG